MAFLRIVEARGGKGIQYKYVRLVEGYGDNGKNKQRVLANLGRKDMLLEHLDALNRMLRGDRLPLRLCAFRMSSDVLEVRPRG